MKEIAPTKNWSALICRPKNLVLLLVGGLVVGLVIGLVTGGILGYNWRTVPEPARPVVAETKGNQIDQKKVKELQTENGELKEKLRFRQNEIDELYRQLANRQFGQPQPAHVKPLPNR